MKLNLLSHNRPLIYFFSFLCAGILLLSNQESLDCDEFAYMVHSSLSWFEIAFQEGKEVLPLFFFRPIVLLTDFNYSVVRIVPIVLSSLGFLFLGLMAIRRNFSGSKEKMQK